MRTTLDLPADLVEQAMALSDQRTKTAVIIEALGEFVRKHNVQELKKFKGKIPLDIDLDALRSRK